ncbi:MAG: ABC transporter substrate-binding protein [Proteobacteria bacterium]|nr:ABC transporter substrate-binding protein [Pseudomonadota bacterium]
MKQATRPVRALALSSLLLTLVGVFATADAWSQTSKRLEKVVYAYPTNISLSNAPTLMAVGMGYFKEAGLDVEITFFQGAAVLLPQVTQKHVMFGWINPDVLITARQPGRDALPVKMFYNGIYESPYEIVVLKNSAVRTVADLRGKKIGVGAMSWGNVAITKALLAENGMAMQRDYEFVPVGVGSTAFRALADGKIDALNLFDTFHLQMELSGIEVRRVPQPAKYVALFSSGWVAHKDTLAERPELVVAFGQAAAKGVVACNANPEACVQNFWKLYPNAKPTKGSDEQKLAEALKILKMRLATMLPADGARKMGRYSAQAWADYVGVLHTGGQVASDKIPVDDLYTNDFVERIDNFDAAAVAASAKSR